MSEFSQAFADRLRSARHQAGMSQEHLADLAGLHSSRISALESGREAPRLETFVRLAGALGVEPAEFLGAIRWKPGAGHYGAFDLGEDGS